VENLTNHHGKEWHPRLLETVQESPLHIEETEDINTWEVDQHVHLCVLRHLLILVDQLENCANLGQNYGYWDKAECHDKTTSVQVNAAKSEITLSKRLRHESVNS